MEFNVYESKTTGALKLRSVLQFKSLVWEEKYCDAGKMQAVFPKNETTLAEIKTGRFALIYGTNRMMYIHSIKLTETEIWAYGYEAKALLQKKFVTNIGGTGAGEVDVDAALVAMLQNECDFTFVDTDYIPAPDMGEKNLDALEYNNLYDYAVEVCQLCQAGWYAGYSEVDRKLHFTITKGVTQSGVIFSSYLGNAWGVQYTRNDQPYVNRVIVVGLDAITDPDNPALVWSEASRANPNEEDLYGFLDLRSEYPRPEDMSLEDYTDAIETRAQSSLAGRHSQEAVTVTNFDASRYGTDYNLGDIVTVRIPEYGLSASMRVNGITRKIEGDIVKAELSMSTVDITN